MRKSLYFIFLFVFLIIATSTLLHAQSCDQSFNVNENRKVGIEILFKNELSFLYPYNCQEIEVVRLQMYNNIQKLKNTIDGVDPKDQNFYDLLSSDILSLESSLQELRLAEEVSSRKEKFDETVAETEFLTIFFGKRICEDGFECFKERINQIATSISSSINAVYHSDNKQIINNLLMNLEQRLSYLKSQLQNNSIYQYKRDLSKYDQISQNLCNIIQDNCLNTVQTKPNIAQAKFNNPDINANQ